MQRTIDQQIDFLTEKLARASIAIDRLPAVVPVQHPGRVTTIAPIRDVRAVLARLQSARLITMPAAMQNIPAAQRATGSNTIAARAVAGK